MLIKRRQVIINSRQYRRECRRNAHEGTRGHMRNEPHGLENREVTLCDGGVMRAKLAVVVA